MIELPNCVKASRIGHWSMGSESEYDAMGEQAPITWTCNCGWSLDLENYDYDKEMYFSVSEDSKAEFLAEHTSCVAKCYKCRVTPVEEKGYWCDECSDKEDEKGYSPDSTFSTDEIGYTHPF